MKNKYEKPSVQVISFRSTDAMANDVEISTSGTGVGGGGGGIFPGTGNNDSPQNQSAYQVN